MTERQVEVNGGRVYYEFVGPEQGDIVVITPGGRFSKEFGGLHEVAEAVAAGGKRVLLWDRPNCGKSDVQLFGRSESHMRADTLGGLTDALGIDRLYVAGGSGGARDSIVFAMMFPEKVRKLALWSIVGGTYSTMSLAGVYVLNEIRAVRSGGIEAVREIQGWKDLVEANPHNAQRLDDLGPAEFEKVMWRWLDAYVPKANESIPGVPDFEFSALDVPTMIIRGGYEDIDHPTRTSLEVHSLIKGSTLVEPPWAEDAWEQAVKSWYAGTGSIFDPWQKAAPLLLEHFSD